MLEAVETILGLHLYEHILVNLTFGEMEQNCYSAVTLIRPDNLLACKISNCVLQVHCSQKFVLKYSRKY